MSIYWLVLFLACGTETAWAISLKLIQTHFSVWVVALTDVLTVVNMVMLSFAMRGIPVGKAYAIWIGLGGAGVAAIGVIFFGDAVTAARLGFLSLIIIGVVGLKLVS